MQLSDISKSILDVYPHPLEDRVFGKLKVPDSAAVAKIGDLAADDRQCAERLRKVAQAVENVLADRESCAKPSTTLFVTLSSRSGVTWPMEERIFFPAAINALQPADRAEIASRLTDRSDPLFSEVVEEKFEVVRRHILQLEQEAEEGTIDAFLMPRFTRGQCFATARCCCWRARIPSRSCIIGADLPAQPAKIEC